MSTTRAEAGSRKLEVGKSLRMVLALLAASYFLLPLSAFPATHVTGTYGLGSNPSVMTTVNGTPEYGLVFVQRNKAVTYNGVQYGTGILNGYLDASGSLNDGAGNLWLDLVPSTTATPSDSYYVVTVNIQGHVHSEIWVVPDAATVDATVVRQTQPAGSSTAAVYYQFVQQSGADLPQRRKLNLTGSGVSCADNAGGLSTDCTITAGSGSSAPIASATTSGTVKTDTTAADPVVYLKTTDDSLLAGKANTIHTHSESDVTNLVTDLAGKVPTSRQISTSAPLTGGGSLAGDLTLSIPAASGSQNGYLASGDWNTFNSKESALTFSAPLARSVNTISCPSCEVTGNKNAANGYAGLSATGKLAASQGQEVWSAADLTDYASASGTGSTALRATITSPAANDVLTWNGSNWINQAPSGGTGHALLSATHTDTTPATVQRGDLVTGQGSTPTWSRLAKGTAGQCLQMDGSGVDVVWGACGAGGGASVADSFITVNHDADLTGERTLSGTSGEIAITDGGANNSMTLSLPATLSTAKTVSAAWLFQPSSDTVGLTSQCFSGGAANCFQVKDASGAISAYVPAGGGFAGTNVNMTGTVWQHGSGTASGYMKANSGNLASTTALNPGLLLYGGDATHSSVGTDFGYSSTTSRFRMRVFGPTTADFSFATASALPPAAQSDFTDLFVVRGDTGRVGIGTSAPSAALSVGSSSQFQVDTSGDIATAGYINAVSGFRVSGGATNGQVLVGNGTNFVSGTVSSAGLATANKTLEKSIVIFSPATTDTNTVQLYFGQAVTLARIACSTDTGTAGINFDTRSESTPNTAGTNVLASNLSCTTTTGTATSFSSAAVSADSPLNLQIASTSGTPGVVRIHVKAQVN
jgi:hypothetical protein